VAVACLVYLAFGMPVAMLGVAWPTLRDDLGRADGDLGLLVLAYGVGRLVTSASSGLVLTKVRFGVASALTLVLLAAASAAVATGPAWGSLIAAIGLIGVLSGVLDSLGARFLAVSGSVRRAGLAAGSYGVGATVGPVVLAVSDSVAVGFVTGAAVALLAAVAVASPVIAWPPGLETRREAVPPPASTVGLVDLLTRPAVLISLGLFAAFVSVEVTAGGWLATVLEDARHVDSRLAGLSVGGFWGGITVGRLLLGRVEVGERALLAAVGVVLACIAALAVVPTFLVLPVATLAGLASSPQFPTLIAHTADRVGEDLAGRVSGWQLIAANIAATSLAAVTGVIVDATGPAAPLVVLFVIALTGGALLVAAGRQRAAATATEAAGQAPRSPRDTSSSASAADRGRANR
jgi:fucose permease